MTIAQLMYRCQEEVKRARPITIIVAVWLTIIVTNYTPGTWLTGWDNLHPEFDFWLNVKRSLVGVWQEHQGLGLLGGMGHAADLPRQIMLWGASLIIPAQLLRWAWTMLMLLVGPLGAYALISSIYRHHTPVDNNNAAALKLSIGRWSGLAGGLFYLLNIGTVQTFLLPFEAFVTHYGFLPWLLWSAGRILTDGATKKNLLVFFTLTVVSATQWYIPTLFVVYLVSLGVLSLAAFSLPMIKRVAIVFFSTVILNSYWLLPFGYFTVTKSSINVNAKINQMATEEVFLKNKAFGTISDTLTLKNFWFNTAEYDSKIGITVPIMAVWRTHTSKTWVRFGLILIASIVVAGFVMTAAKRETRGWALVGLASFAMIAVDTPPFRELMDLLRRHVPLLTQFFRFPFTKWSVLLMVSYSVFIGTFVVMVTDYVARLRVKSITPSVVTLVMAGLLMIPMLPAFASQLVSPMMRREIPKEYFELFAYLKTKPEGRIANLPQPTFWGWMYYRWGFTGSGFLWYGIEHPILDRAFDVWSTESEQYFWELSRALYRKDATAVNAVLAKYDVRYILLDEHIISPSSDRGLYIEETKELLGQMPSIREIFRFGKIIVYEQTNGSNQSFVSVKSNLPTIYPTYQWTDNDVAFREVGDYIAELTTPDVRTSFTSGVYAYPFRSLFTKRSTSEWEFEVEENEDTIIIHSLLLHGPGPIAAKKKMDEQKNTYEEDRINDPGVQIQINKVDLRQIYHTLFPLRVVASENDTHKPNNDPDQQIDNDKFYGIGFHDQNERSSSQIAATSETIPISKLAVNTVDQSPRPENTVGNITKDITTTVTGDTYRVNITIPKIDSVAYDSTRSADLAAENVQPCGVVRDGTATAQNIDQILRFTSRNQRGCLSFGIPDLPHRDGYLVAVQSRHISGRPLLFSLINQTAKHVEVETYLQPRRVRPFEATDDFYFILPPLAKDGLGYTVYLSNDAIGRQETINDIRSIKFYRIPYQEMVAMRIGSSPNNPASFTDVTVDHPNPAYYLAKLDPAPQGNQTLILSQSFDPGWTAWEKIPTFPYLRQLKEHVLVNNWSNGWKLSSDCRTTDDCRPALPAGGLTTIVLFFLPQLLQWLGFALLPVPFLIALHRRKK